MQQLESVLVLSIIIAVAKAQSDSCLRQYENCATLHNSFQSGKPGKRGLQGPPGPPGVCKGNAAFGSTQGQCDCEKEIQLLKIQIQTILGTLQKLMVTPPTTTTPTTTTPTTTSTTTTKPWWWATTTTLPWWATTTTTSTTTTPATTQTIFSSGDCNKRLGAEYGGVLSDSAFRASTFTDSMKQAKHGRLNHPKNARSSGGWLSRHPYVDQYIEVDLGSIHKVSGVLTQGNPEWPFLVTEFQVQYGITRSGLEYVTVPGASIPKTFPGNDPNSRDRNAVVQNNFPSIVEAKLIRIYPTKWKGGPFLRFEVLGCVV